MAQKPEIVLRCPSKFSYSFQDESHLINLTTLFKLLEIPHTDGKLLSIRHSKKAKRLIFKSSVSKGLEIVLPRFYDEHWVVEVITKRKPKILERLCEIQKARSEYRPSSVYLPSMQSSWRIRYTGTTGNDSVGVKQSTTILEVPEKTEDILWVPMILQEWLQGIAMEYLPKHLDNVSAKLNLSYNKVRIKRQKSRWGSCSIKRNINLNRNLLFMPVEVVDYVIHHELIHLKTLDHSHKFWRQLGKVFPEVKECQKILKNDEKNSVPTWAFA